MYKLGVNLGSMGWRGAWDARSFYCRGIGDGHMIPSVLAITLGETQGHRERRAVGVPGEVSNAVPGLLILLIFPPSVFRGT